MRRLRLWDGHSRLALRAASDAAHSNVTIEARCAAGHFALRLPNHDVSGFIDRDAELKAQALAWRLNIGAEPAGFDEATGIVATRWIEDSAPLTTVLSRDDPALLDRAVMLLRRLHDSGAILPRTLDARAVVASYRARLPTPNLQPIWTAAVDRAVDNALGAMAGELAPCHGDMTPANILLTPDGLRLIDWEYAVMADPAWDLGYLASEASLDDGGVARLVGEYQDSAMTVARVRAAMILAAAVSTLWSLLRLRARPSPEIEAAFETRRNTLLALAAQ